MKLLVAGGTGFIGAALCQTLAQRGDDVLVLTRFPGRQIPMAGTEYLDWDDTRWVPLLAEVDGVVNLAGESIAAKPWTPQQKLALQESRLQTTRRLVDAMAAQAKHPGFFINASAVGYFGPRDDEPLAEEASAGRGFLAELCRAWEVQAQRAEPLGLRVIRLRIGLVLGPGGGALQKMAPAFQSFLGGPLGTGRQWVSWIHRADVIGLIEWLADRQEVSGPVNATAPQPVTMRQLCAELGRVLHRPSWVPVPGAMVRLLLGEMADLLLTGQRVMPRVALHAGYTFQYPDIAQALRACLIPEESG